MVNNRTFDAFVFDLDGTLLDTLPDLVAVTNEVLASFELPTHSRNEILAMVGNGLRSSSLKPCRKTFPRRGRAHPRLLEKDLRRARTNAYVDLRRHDGGTPGA